MLLFFSLINTSFTTPQILTATSEPCPYLMGVPRHNNVFMLLLLKVLQLYQLLLCFNTLFISTYFTEKKVSFRFFSLFNFFLDS